MSYQIGFDTVHLKPTDRYAHTEYCSNAPLKRAIAELNRNAGIERTFEEAWDIDLIWSTDDGPIYWGKRGRVTDMGHAEFMEGGVDMRQPKKCPFGEVEEVWEFDAVQEYGLLDFGELVDYYETSWHKAQHETFPNSVFTAGYYKTIISGAIDTFGWDMLLLGASDQDKFERVLDSFFRMSMHHIQAWAKTSAPVFISHDDFVWSEGAFIHPDFYRRVITPRYALLWKVLKDAGKRVLFCADANWVEFLDDIAEAGADGFIFEPMMPLEPVVEKYGKTHVIVGSKVDTRTLTFGTKPQIKAEVEATLPWARQCNGFMFAVGNHIPANVPVENAEYYLQCLREVWWR